MNRVYRLVWSRALNAVQVAPEHAHAHGGVSGRFTARALRRHPLAVATFAFASMSVPAWGQTCTPTSPVGCAAPGGAGEHAGRNNDGGAGNGAGGNATSRDSNGTAEVTGASADGNGNGGAGATSVDSVATPAVMAAGGTGGPVGATGSAGVNASVTGGVGQPGEPSSALSFFGGGGGGGGAGVFINDANSTPTVSAATVISGGAGGAGGDQNTATNGDAGSGGGGGAGGIVGAGAGGVSLSNNGRLSGGAGGAGGNHGYAGSGGGGGDGLLLLGSGAGVVNNVGANITGGAGGAPGQATDGTSATGGFGGGGAGVNMVGAGSSLTNAGTITGGGAGGSGTAGVGVRGWGGAVVTTNGSILGGVNGSGTQADSVLFSGGGNQLVIDGGATFTGHIVSTSGTANGGDTLTLGGNTAGTINLGLIVGFANNIKAGNSAWTLTGAGIGGINWTVEQGQLIGNAGTFGGNLMFASSGVGTPSIEFNQTATGTFGGQIGGQGELIKAGAGGLTLSGDLSTFSGQFAINQGNVVLTGTGDLHGAEVSGGAITLDVSGISGPSANLAGLSGNGSVTLGTHTLVLENPANDAFNGTISGSGGLTVDGGTQTLAGTNTYTGDTVVDGGTLAFGTNGQISGSRVQIDSGTLDVSGKTAGSSLSIMSLAGSGNVNLGNAGLTLGNADDTYGGVIAGTGTITVGSGREVFNGVNTYTGLTAISSGATLVVGDSSHATAQVAGDVTVDGGTLGGFGTVLGNATVSNGGTLVAGDVGSVGTLTVNGNLAVGTGSKLAFDFGAPGPNFSTPGQSDHVVVTGNLSIGSSTLNVNNLGSMGPGLYNLFDWGGSLDITDSGFAAPAGMTLQVLTADKQINLVDTQGLTLNQWDADGRASANGMGGGSGTWNATSNSWANASGEIVGPMTPQPSFAIFGGTAGTVTIDNSDGAVSTTGMQFTSDGYHLVGDTLDLVGQGGAAPVVRVSSGATATVDNVLSGTSGLNKTDGGTLVLTGNNLYQGTTTLSGGYLSVSSDANLGQGANALDFEGGTLKITGTSFNQTARNIVWGSAGGGFDIDDATNTFTLAQALTGAGGLLKSGAGTLLLNGQNTYSGGTIVSGGTLEVGDADHPGASVVGDMQVNATGTLSGHGTVAGSIANNGGTVSPGGSIGTLSVGGNYTQASNGVLAVEVSPTAASLLNVAGAATLNGVLAITYDPGTYTAKQYTLVAAAQGVSGQFSGVTKTVSTGADLGSLQQNVIYSANQVALDLADASAVIAPTGISIYTALGSSVSMGSQTANSTLLARMNQVSAATAGAPYSWIDATGAQTHVGGANGEPGYQANRYGFLAGLDSKVGEYTFGVATGYAHTDVDEQQTGDSATADTLRVALYGSRWFGPVGVSATAGYALDFLSQKRPFGALGTAEGDHIGHEFTTAGQASMPLTFGSFVVTPSVGMRFAYFHANGFDESGADGQDLDVGTDNVQSLQPYAQVTFDKAFGDALRPVDMQVRVGYAHEVLNANRVISVAAQDGTVFAAPGTSLPRGYLTAGVSLQMEPTKSMSVAIAYDTLINTTHASTQAASLKLGYKF